MKRAPLVALLSLVTAISPLYATQSLSITGPDHWGAGTSVTLSVFDMYSGFGSGSLGLSYWFEVPNALAPFITITSVTRVTFTHPNNVGTFPLYFDTSEGADPGYMSTLEADHSCGGQPCTGDLGGMNEPFMPIPDGTYHVTDITFALAPNAPAGTYTLRTTTASPRGSVQIGADFSDHAFPQASFVFNVVPEPSTLALIALTGIAAAVMAYRHRK